MNTKEISTLVYAYFDRLFNQRDFSVCDAVLAPDYIDHDAPPNTPPGPKGTKEFAQGFLANYPDLKVRVEDVIAGDLKAAAQIIWRGTHYETGEKFHQRGNIIIHLNTDGYFVECWSVYENVNS